MGNSNFKSLSISIAISALILGSGMASADDDIANGLDPLTTGQVMGRYAGGTLLPGEYFPTLEEFRSPQIASDEDIANGLDPLTTGQVVGLYAGGTLLPGEYFPTSDVAGPTGEIKLATDK